MEKIETQSIEYAKKLGCDAAAGHTHVPVQRVGADRHFNSGCWTEKPCHYLSVRCGEIIVRQYEFADVPDEVLVA